MTVLVRSLVLLLVLQCLSGCQSWWPWGDSASSTKIKEDPVTLERRALIQNSLDQGKLALQTDRLSLPKQDSAVFYFRRVLDVDPANHEAKIGLNAVVKRYLQLAEIAHGNGDDKKANSWIKRAEEVNGPSTKTTGMRSQLKKTPAGQHQREIEYLPASDYQLSREELDQRGPEIHTHLADIAKRAESRKRAVLVIARDQAEGDWIAKVLRESVPNYVLKTQVKIASRPAVILVSESQLSRSSQAEKSLVDRKKINPKKQAAVKKVLQQTDKQQNTQQGVNRK
jgi:hypothetical protein